MQTIVNANTLKAILLFAAKKDIRYYLNGILLEIGNKGARLVGTDGHVMGVVGLDQTATEYTEVIIRRDTIEQALKLCKKGESLSIEVDPGTFNPKALRTVTIKGTGGVAMGQELDGKFPDYRRVIPAKVSGEPAAYNPEHLDRCKRARNAATGSASTPEIGYNGLSSAVLDIADNFLAIVMPMRGDLLTYVPHHSLTQPTNVEAKPETVSA